MIGKIKVYKTKWDVSVGMELQPEQTKADLAQMYAERMIWGNTTLITDAGVNDATHRTIQSVNMETQEPETYQQELVQDANAYIYNVLGYTDGEILALIGD